MNLCCLHLLGLGTSVLPRELPAEGSPKRGTRRERLGPRASKTDALFWPSEALHADGAQMYLGDKH